MMEFQTCYFLDGPKRGESMLFPVPLRPRFYVAKAIMPDFRFPPERPNEFIPIEDIEYRLHEYYDESHRGLVYISELDDEEAWWAYCRHYATEHPDRLKFLLSLAYDAGIRLRLRGNEIQCGVTDGPGMTGWTPDQNFVAEFLGRYEILLLGFFELAGLREE